MIDTIDITTFNTYLATLTANNSDGTNPLIENFSNWSTEQLKDFLSKTDTNDNNPLMLAIIANNLLAVQAICTQLLDDTSSLTLTELETAAIFQATNEDGCNALMLACDPTNTNFQSDAGLNYDILTALLDVMAVLSKQSNNIIYTQTNNYSPKQINIVGVNQSADIAGLTALGMICFFPINYCSCSVFKTYYMSTQVSFSDYCTIYQTLKINVLNISLSFFQNNTNNPDTGNIIPVIQASLSFYKQLNILLNPDSQSNTPIATPEPIVITKTIIETSKTAYVVSILSILFGLASLAWGIYNKFYSHK